MRKEPSTPGENNIPSQFSIVFGRKQRIAQNWSDSEKEKKWVGLMALAAKRRRLNSCSQFFNKLHSLFSGKILCLEIVYNAKTAK
jgi:hypothetical protein